MLSYKRILLNVLHLIDVKLNKEGKNMWITLNFLFWLFLLIFTLVGLTRHSSKKLVKGLILSRIFYICLIISQVMITFFYFKSRPFVVSLSGILCLASAALVETGFRKKQSGNFTNLTLYLVVAILLIYMIFQTWSILPTSVY
ncbi:MAG: DUF1516 family protein [Acetilactobacillus jinshanensis]